MTFDHICWYSTFTRSKLTCYIRFTQCHEISSLDLASVLTVYMKPSKQSFLPPLLVVMISLNAMVLNKRVNDLFSSMLIL